MELTEEIETMEAALIQELKNRQLSAGLSDENFGRQIGFTGSIWAFRKNKKRPFVSDFAAFRFLNAVKKAFPDLSPLIEECLHKRNIDTTRLGGAHGGRMASSH